MSLPTVHLICNAHLDPVWQWRWEEGAAETLSTFSTAVDLLREYPSLIFNHNEAVLYQWVRDYDPLLFAEIQSLVAAGRWCISGGWFLQPDVNLPDTESLIRHIIVGRRFFWKFFGVTPRVAYNFDSFGHSAGLPQLLVRSGFEMYIHLRPQAAELSLPSDLYRWRGLDGSEVAALRIAVGLYHTERDNIEERLRRGTELALKLNRDVPVFWGLGDHGGGPTRGDLRRIDEFTAKEHRVCVMHSTPERLYEALKMAAAKAPVVEADLQRVFTGCYTSLARVKRQAVVSLSRLVRTEALRAVTWWQFGQDFPAAQLENAWRDHLFNDFHDILAGSCIEAAEQDALGLYARVGEEVRRLSLSAAAAFNAGPRQPCYIPVTLLNANPGRTTAPVEVECMLDLRPKWSGTWHLRLRTLEGTEIVCQEEQPECLLPFNGWRRKVAFVAEFPPLGAKHYKLEISEGQAVRPGAPPALPHHYDVRCGLVTGLEAVDGCECLSGSLFKPLVIEDTGDSWGANQWSYRNVVGTFECVPGSVIPLASGPVRTNTESVHQFGSSRIVLHTIAYATLPLLEFRLRIYWQEQRRRLKLSVPTLFNTDTVTCEVPGGVWRRPGGGQEHVHRRWLMVERNLQGKPAALAIIHDGLHGFDASQGEIRLSVLRSVAYCHEHTFPLGDRPERKWMDQGIHEVRLLVLTGEPARLRAEASGWADWLTAPPAAYSHLPIGKPLAESAPPFRPESIPPDLRLLACKQSEDGQALVLRFQEVAGKATIADLSSETLSKPSPSAFKPYEIKTFRLERNGSVREVDMIREV